MNGDQDRATRTLSLTTGTITLLGVLLSIGVTVAFAIDATGGFRS